MTRRAGFLIHLVITLVALAALVAVVVTVWYPDPLLRYQGALRPLLLMVMSALVAGPVLTLVLLRPGKRGLWFDLALIPVLQIAATGWGVWVLYSERPGWLVFSVDRVYIVSVRDAAGVHRQPSPWHRPELVHAPVWDIPGAAVEVLMGQRPHSHLVPSRYQSLQVHLPQLAPAALDPAALPAALVAEIGAAQVQSGELLLFPFHGRRLDGTLALSRADGSVAAVVDVDPERPTAEGDLDD